LSHKPNVLIVHNYYKIPGGEDTVVSNEMEMLRRNGHKVVLYSRNNTEIDSFSVFGKLKLPFTAIFSMKTYREIVKIIRREKIDIVHVHNTLSLISPAVYYAARHCKVPVVQTIHNFRLLCPGAAFYRDGHVCEDCTQKGLGCAVKHSCYRQSRAQTLVCVVSTMIHRMLGIYGRISYICLTEFNKEKLTGLRQIASERVYIKPNFVNDGDSSAVPEADRSGFVFISRLDKLKGIDILLEAWKIMGDDAPELTICGNGPMEDWCREFIAENGLTRVEMKGLVSNSEAIRLMSMSKALVLPTQWYEGFPMSMVEAFSVGTPVICSSLGNAGDMVTEGENGAKFEADSPETLVEAIQRFESYSGIYRRTKEHYQNNYTEEHNYRIMSDIYDSVMR